MALPVAANSQIFSNDQKINFRAFYWDTTTTAIRLGPSHSSEEQYTASGSGVEMAMFDLLSSSFAPTTRTALENALAKSSGQTRSILGYDAQSDAYRSGVVPNIYMYWGAGAPAGASRAKQVLLKFSGYVRDAGQVTLAFAGQGTVHVYKNGSNTPILAGTLKEPQPLVALTGVNAARINGEWGYQYVTHTFAAGDHVEIYYWHNGENWGGIAAKVYPGAMTTNSDAFLSQLRSASVIGTSYLAKEQNPLAALDIPYIKQAELRRQEDSVQTLTLSVAISSPIYRTGYFLDPIRDEYNLVDNADPGKKIKKGRVVHFEGGFKRPDNTDELYPRFTGYIEDIFPDADGETASVVCRSFDGKLADTFDENNPDRLTYHSNGYILRERASEPVFGIPAFDYWPLEIVARDLCARAGIDMYSLGRSALNLNPDFGKWRFVDNKSQNPTYGASLLSARLLASPSKLIIIERNPNYGNVPPLQKDFFPKDDAYLFPPVVTQRLYDRLKGLTNHYGYDFFFNPEGRVVLTGRNNPVYFQYATKNGTYLSGVNEADFEVAVSTVGGIYLEKQHTVDGTGWNRTFTGHFSRLDLYVGIGEKAGTGINGGKLRVITEVNDGAGNWTEVFRTTFTTFVESDEGFYYTGLVRQDGTNAAVFKVVGLPFDHYRVKVEPAGVQPGETDAFYRINGAAIYERDPEQSYYSTTSGQARTFTTLGNTLQVTPESNFKDLRNHVIVVGARKATLTDSSKLDDGNDANPNNPEFEFHVAVAVDPFSIYDPTSPNYVGMKRMTIVFDQKVNDSEFARWLTRTILFRYRMPKSSAKFRHTVIPTIEPRDAMFVVEEKNRSIEHLLYVTNYVERWSLKEAVTEIDADANPEIPSFQPREDIDIDTLFRRDASDPISGVPLINFEINYKNVYGLDVTNTELFDATTIKKFASKEKGKSAPMIAELLGSGHSTSITLAQTAIPETFYLGYNVSTNSPDVVELTPTSYRGFTVFTKRVLVNNPYRHFFYFDTWNGSKKPTVQFTFQEGDGTAGVYDKTYYGFPDTGSKSWFACYDHLVNRTDASSNPEISPFYDPYSSEVGNLIEISFDLLVSGRVRVTVFDANQQSAGVPVPVAYLSNPAGDPEEENAHWIFMDAGERKTFVWDGVDNIGMWNVLQSFEWSEETKGVFGDRPNAVGRGYYVWNDKTTNRHTYIGDMNAANFDSANAPYFTIGQFGQFMIRVEVVNDDLARKDLATLGRSEPRTVWSNDLPNSPTWNSTTATYVWTHLGEPTQVGIRIQDWIGAGSWTRTTDYNPADWGDYSTPNTDATFADGKPIRMTYVPRARRSPFWVTAGALDPKKISVKLTRSVHLKATIFDQFWTLYGKSWDIHPSLNASGIERKRLNNRMFHNEDHTLEFEDGDWRTGENLEVYDWIFDPSLFEKDFGRGQKERLRFGDYEQLEDLPGFDAQKLGGTAAGQRAYMMMAYISYLMYFSAFTLDRSGRRQWCLNSWKDTGGQRGFVDKSKIVTSSWLAASGKPGDGTYTKYAVVDYPTAGADRYLLRSMFVRQWKEPTWATGTYPGNPITEWSIGAGFLNFIQPRAVKMPLQNTDGDALIGDVADAWSTQYAGASGISGAVRRLSGGASAAVIVALSSYTRGVSAFGTWDFDRPTVEDFFVPVPSRDFQPYWRYPFMPDWAIAETPSYTTADQNNYFNSLNVYETTGSNALFKLRDPAAQQIWYGWVTKPGVNMGLSSPAPILENTAEEAGADPGQPFFNLLSGAALAGMFDYAKEDNLDRFDQFRGVVSRAPYADRTRHERDTWSQSNKKRAAPAQPVKPSGAYLLNVARYTDYTVAPVHVAIPGVLIHFCDFVTDWFDIRFAHEYVWYSPRFFPVTREGGSVYCYTWDEFTKVSGHFGTPWWSKQTGSGFRGGGKESRGIGGTLQTTVWFSAQDINFDAGAWTGHKWDIKSSNWSTTPKLRWRERGSGQGTVITRNNITTKRDDQMSGGFEAGFSPTGQATANVTWNSVNAGTTYSTHRRMNMFDDLEAFSSIARLAVGPEVPEARGIFMNLTLPKRLKG